MAKNFYNLPSPWNPGYAIPDSVLDEGLERRAFVTGMTPRGTYDDPTIGNAGYDVPRYIDDEGYGQGTFTTKWLPRGYYGPGMPHWLDQTFTKIVGTAPASGDGTVLKMETLGDDAKPYRASARPIDDRFQQFGRRSAAALMNAASSLPEGQRERAMRASMDAMDPGLYGRTITYANRLARRGFPKRAALAHGLAAGITEGMLAELARAGSSRTAPQAHSLPGLGCYGCKTALGATPTMTIVGTVSGSPIAVGPSAPTTAACPTGQTKYKWVEAAGGVAAHWERARTGESGVCISGAAPSGPPGGVTVTDTNVLVVGPLEMPANANRSSFLTFKSPSDIARVSGLAEWIRKAWTTETGGGGFLVWNPSDANSIGSRAGWQAYVNPWIAAVGIAPGTKIDTRKVMSFLPGASYKFPNPIDGNKEWAVTIGLYTQDGKLPAPPAGANDQTVPLMLRIAIVKPSDPGLLSKVLSTVAKVAKPAAVYGGGILSGAIDMVGDLACQLVTQPGAAAAAAAASGGAAAVGTSIAAGICGNPSQPIPVPVAEPTDYTMPIVIGAGAIGLALILSKKKKKG